MTYSSGCYFQEDYPAKPLTLPNGLKQTIFRVGSHDVLIYKSNRWCESDLLTYDSGLTVDRTGLVMWPGSTVVAHALLALGKHGTLFGRSVLELGCGVGFCSVIASMFAKEVVVTDQSSEMRAIARANLRANRDLIWTSTHEARSSCCTTQVLGLAWSGTGHLHQPFDDSGTRQFDLLIASDVLYVDEPRFGGLEQPDVASFLKVIHGKLARGGLALMAYANREHRGAETIKECSVQCELECIELPLASFMPPNVLHAEGARALSSIILFGFAHCDSRYKRSKSSGGSVPDTFCMLARKLLEEMDTSII